MPTAIWLNGEFTERDSAMVSALDAGVQHGVGLFETMHASGGRVFRLHDHLARLQRSARTLGLTESLRINPLAEAVRRTVERAGEDRARVRLTLTGGAGHGAPGRPGVEGADPTILIVAQRATEYPEAMFERGVAVALAETRISHADPCAGHKTLNYWWRLRELRIAGARGGAEALLFDTTNHLACGMVSNVFLVRDGLLRTPPAWGEYEAGAPADAPDPRAASGGAAPARPTLPGITRMAVLDGAGELGLECAALPLTIEDVLGADEVFLTNSGWGVLPVTRIEGHVVGAGAPGPVARELRAKWLGAVHEQLPG